MSRSARKLSTTVAAVLVLDLAVIWYLDYGAVLPPICGTIRIVCGALGTTVDASIARLLLSLVAALGVDIVFEFFALRTHNAADRAPGRFGEAESITTPACLIESIDPANSQCTDT